ncbi:MAG: biotin/lipoyl-containing protein [Lachnospiraceae bacterium]
MKNYTITVNGNVYDVSVEENETGMTQTAASSVIPKTVVTPAASTKPSTKGTGKIKIEAGAAGKIFKVETNVGQKVIKGDTLIILEAMKMEIPVVASESGTIASIDVSVGDAVEAGAVLATLN